MTTECIHGLEFARCDACSPTAAPPARSATAARPAVKRTPAKRSSTSRASGPAKVDTGARRIFHITHRRNLPGILAQGRVLADISGATPLVDISAPDNRELRRELRAGSAQPAAAVGAYVPFFLVPNPFLWERMRDSDADLRLAEAVHTMPAADFVMLVSTVRAGGELAVIADGDAADPSTRFSALAELGGRMPRRLDEEDHAMFDAEFLVPGEFAFASVTLIGVANDRVRSDVRALLAEHGFHQKVSVYPPWFQPSTF